MSLKSMLQRRGLPHEYEFGNGPTDRSGKLTGKLPLMIPVKPKKKKAKVWSK